MDVHVFIYLYVHITFDMLIFKQTCIYIHRDISLSYTRTFKYQDFRLLVIIDISFYFFFTKIHIFCLLLGPLVRNWIFWPVATRSRFPRERACSCHAAGHALEGDICSLRIAEHCCQQRATGGFKWPLDHRNKTQGSHDNYWSIVT